MKALGEIGMRRARRVVQSSALLAIFRMTPLPLRSLFLRLCGATIGSDTILYPFRLINVDRGDGFKSLHIGANCFVGHEVMIDLAGPVVLEDHVTIAARVMLITHLNVGYKDHPLMTRFPPKTAGLRILRGSFVGASAVVLPGCRIGPEAFVAAAALVNRDVATGEVVAGVPIRQIG
jgi:acetyltransferase-like isoleucine patch superfamily enzyme